MAVTAPEVVARIQSFGKRSEELRRRKTKKGRMRGAGGEEIEEEEMRARFQRDDKKREETAEVAWNLLTHLQTLAIARTHGCPPT